jgi:hypothetical protein
MTPARTRPPQPHLERDTRPHHAFERSRMSTCALLVLLVAALAALVPGLSRPWQGPAPASATAWTLLAVAAVLLSAGAWRARRVLAGTLTSIEFSVALLVALLLCTIAGTLVLQGATPEQYLERYGERGAWLVRVLGLDDLFHTPWFTSLLGLMAVSLAVTLVRTRSWRLERWGHLAAHGGMIVILVGGLIGAVFGMKGMVELREGETASHFMRTDVPGELAPLGFTLRLDTFGLEHHDDAWRFYHYERDGMDWDAAKAFVPELSTDWQDLGPETGAFAVRRLYDDLRTAMDPSGPESGAAALELAIAVGDDVRKLTLWDGVKGSDMAMLPESALRFCWSAPHLPAVDDAHPAPSEHLIEVQLTEGGPVQRLHVQPGEVHVLDDGAWVLEVLTFLPDFTYDVEAGHATTASWRPDNPALSVALRSTQGGDDETRWLFAHMPDWGVGHGETDAGPGLVYVHEASAAEVLLVVGELGEVWRLRGGGVAERWPLEPLEPDAGDPALGATTPHQVALAPTGLGSTITGLTLRAPRAQPAPEDDALTPIWAGAPAPGALVELRDPAGHVTTRLMNTDPVYLPDGGVLMLGQRGDGVKAYISEVSVIEDGQVARQVEVRVNHPLAHAGLHIYQSNFKREDLAWSGFQVVKDPGLTTVFVGMCLMVLGVAWLLLVRPRLAAKGGTP